LKWGRKRNGYWRTGGRLIGQHRQPDGGVRIERAAPARRPRSGRGWSRALSGGHARGEKVLIRIDGAGGTHELPAWLTRRWPSYSVGFSLPGDLTSIRKALASIGARAWTPAYDADRHVRPGAFIAEVTGLFNLWLAAGDAADRPQGASHPGAQLRNTDVDGMRITAFVTNTTRGQQQPLALRGEVLGVGRDAGVADEQRRHGAPPQAGRSRRSGASVTGDGRSRYWQTVITTHAPSGRSKCWTPEQVKESTPQGDW
jgi:hypothetical protein